MGEVPDEAEAENPKPEIEGWEKKSLNATSLEPSTSGWGVQFCTAHHVGYFCRGFTRVRCCRSTWGFRRCGSSVHYRGCGWHGYGYNEATQGDSNAAQLPETAAVDEEDAGVYPDETTGYDEVGHSSPCPTRVKLRTQSQPSQVGTIPLRFKRRHFTRGAAPSAKSTTLATSAMASLECAAASSKGASSNVAPQHMPVAVDTAVVQFQSQAQV